jgi:Ran GTPase-activating protein (RanGAP) involved in mRNA processing and transport
MLTLIGILFLSVKILLKSILLLNCKFSLKGRLTAPKLEALYLRANGIDDEDMIAICDKLKTSTLKSLDLSLNKFTQKSIALLANTLKENVILEALGLAGLNLNLKDFEVLLEEFGKFPISAEQAAELQQKITERDAIITKNKKAKGKKVEVVPIVPGLIQDEQGNACVVKKETFGYLNIGLNNLDDSAVEEIDKLLARTPPKFTMGITSRSMSKEVTQSLVSKYGERVFA